MEVILEYREVQQIAKDTIAYAKRVIRKLCEQKMLELGADSFWYWDIGAFVFAGDETTISVSGKQYITSNRTIAENDIITIDLSPQNGNIWGDYARTIIIENGELLKFVNFNTTFEELYFHINELITKSGYVNLDFMGNLGHSIVKEKSDRVYTEKRNVQRLSNVTYFTFEPHISIHGSKYGFKKENIYYFQNGKLIEL